MHTCTCSEGPSSRRANRYRNVDKISNLKLSGEECDAVVGAATSRARLPEVLHSEAPAWIGVDGGKGKDGSLLSGLGVDLANEGHELTQRAVHPWGDETQAGISKTYQPMKSCL